MDTKRAKRVLKEVLEDKKDNLIKLKLDLYYRLTLAPRWEKQKKELEENKGRMLQELKVLNMTGGQTFKTKEKILNFERDIRVIDEKLGNINKGLNEISVIAKTFHVADEFTTLIEKTVGNPEILDEGTKEQIKKFKEK